MSLTPKLSVLTDYWYNLFEKNKEELNLAAVYYGDQAKIPFSPALCVDPGEKQNNLRRAAASRALDPNVNISVIIYFSAVSSTQDDARQSIITAESVEDFIHTKRNADGLVIHCHVTSVEAGYIERSNTLMRATRLNIEHRTQTILPS